ncbi:hypothetical protein ARMGADRAFT_915394 [Armillaria gallica]|uniref:Fungal-type protein kinase domain-containing protein n=1 Tax=Armillaria gallica TaxID=47427 RepID=A0A2H3EDZ2_ARMGA|nr:hypothetical protein ARMGADRAFT_915394 [Armillaria gallica]
MTETEKTHWLLNHLPNIFHEQDFKFDDDDSVQKLIAEMINAGKYVGGRAGAYEERVLRITVLEELFPITSLRKDSDYAQVFVDILQCHMWLYDHPKVLHRDISMANIMCRVDSAGNVFGVLNDFVLNSGRGGHAPPSDGYAALHGLRPAQRGEGSWPHLHCYDLEALFYGMLMIFCRHSIINEPQPDGTS